LEVKDQKKRIISLGDSQTTENTTIKGLIENLMNNLDSWNRSQQEETKDNLSQIEITISDETNNLMNMIRETDAKNLVTETQDMLIQLAKCL
jgi:hypothetical protein